MVKLLENRTCMTIEQAEKSGIIGCHCTGRPESFDLVELLFEICSNCGCNLVDMSTIGHGAFAACKVRQNNEKLLDKINSIDYEKEKFYDGQHNMQENPMKYSSILMKSVWGMYNRYSVHNFKKNRGHEVASLSVAANRQLKSVGSAATFTTERSTGDTNKTAKTSPQLLPSFWAPYDYSY